MSIESLVRALTAARRQIPGIRQIGLAGMAVGVCAVLALPERAGAEGTAPGADTCITVELIMYSGRPRPSYRICDAKEIREALAKTAAVQEQETPATVAPNMESTPAYQGILLTLPGQPGANRRFVLRAGFLKELGGELRKDKGRSLEKFFLERSLREQDLAEPAGKEAPIGRVSEAILDQVSREPAE